MKKVLTLTALLALSIPAISLAEDNWFCTGIKGKKHCMQGKYGRATEVICRDLCKNNGMSPTEILHQREEAAQLAKANKTKKIGKLKM